ncbi:hypothetical protein [Vibrio quintilis]|uniref:Outer membrane protein beta-barrel domain-containing protein n=1 Tax=Vibrio quintilis TaxID=1117707 RepID=A0A1M7YQK9_9VIBR|nr:hypothetical protein [Vibrio quintilis]SHO54931.1 hypothetical protein VQ7734_00650 [Vibrio quintilis]
MKQQNYIALWAALFFSSACAANNNWHVGAEADVLPYLLNGHYFSLTAGRGHLKFRGVVTKFESPDMFTQNGFKDHQVDVGAVIVDYYPDPSQQGFWIGFGAEQWRGDVTEEQSSDRKSYQTYLATLGCGYVHYLAPHIYVNPWAGIHVPVAGDKSVKFGSSAFDMKTTGEVSVKIGVNF